jgi:hypothetical protein
MSLDNSKNLAQTHHHYESTAMKLPTQSVSETEKMIFWKLWKIRKKSRKLNRSRGYA